MKKPRVATNDSVIDTLLADHAYSVHANGTVWRNSGGVWKQTGRAKTYKSGKTYFHLKYKGSNILVHRIVYRKFNGLLDQSLIINHIDGDSLNNLPKNLDLVTQELNMIHAAVTR